MRKVKRSGLSFSDVSCSARVISPVTKSFSTFKLLPWHKSPFQITVCYKKLEERRLKACLCVRSTGRTSQYLTGFYQRLIYSTSGGSIHARDWLIRASGLKECKTSRNSRVQLERSQVRHVPPGTPANQTISASGLRLVRYQHESQVEERGGRFHLSAACPDVKLTACAQQNDSACLNLLTTLWCCFLLPVWWTSPDFIFH